MLVDLFYWPAITLFGRLILPTKAEGQPLTTLVCVLSDLIMPMAFHCNLDLHIRHARALTFDHASHIENLTDGSAKKIFTADFLCFTHP